MLTSFADFSNCLFTKPIRPRLTLDRYRKANINHNTASSFTPVNQPNSLDPLYLPSTGTNGSKEQSNDTPKHSCLPKERNSLVAEYPEFDEDTEVPPKFERDGGNAPGTRNRVGGGGGGNQWNMPSATTKTAVAKSKGKAKKRSVFDGLRITKATAQLWPEISKNKLSFGYSKDTEAPIKSSGTDTWPNVVDISEVIQNKLGSWNKASEPITDLQGSSLPHGIPKHGGISLILPTTPLDAVRAQQGFGSIICQGPYQANTGLISLPQSDSIYLTKKALRIKGPISLAHNDTAKPSAAVGDVRNLPLNYILEGNTPNLVQESWRLTRKGCVTRHNNPQSGSSLPFTIDYGHIINRDKSTSSLNILTPTELPETETAAMILQSSLGLVPSAPIDSWSHSKVFKSDHRSDRDNNNLPHSQGQIVHEESERAPPSNSFGSSCVASSHTSQASVELDAFEDLDDGISDSDLLMFTANEEAGKGETSCEMSSTLHEALTRQTQGSHNSSRLRQREPGTMEKDNRDDWTFLEDDENFLDLDFSDGPSSSVAEPSSSTDRESHAFFIENSAVTDISRSELDNTDDLCHPEEGIVPELTLSGALKLNKNSRHLSNHTPFVRPPFPVQVRDRSPIIGLSSKSLLRTCFRVGEALNVGRQAVRNGKPTIIELYARVASSWREPDSVKQHFVFSDLFHDHPPFMNGVYGLWKGVELWDYDSGRFLNPSEQQRMCRCIGKMKRDGKKWKLVVLNIWEATWDDVDYAQGIICA